MRQIRRIFSAILVLLGVVIVVPAFAGLASAHHSNIAASATCDGTVSWTATSWSTGAEGSNTDILVSKTINGVKTDIQHGQFTPANLYQFSGTFVWPVTTPATTSITISSLPIDAWGNGTVSPVGSSVDVSAPTGCPGTPAVTPAVSCVNTSPGNGDGTVVLTLTNPAGPFGSPAVFTVYPVDQTTGSTDYTVATGGSQLVTFAGIADGAHFVKISVGSAPVVDKTQNFTVDCDQQGPAVTNTAACVDGNGQVVVTLTNTGGEAVTFDVTNPANAADVEHVTVGPNSFTTRTFGGFSDGTQTIVIMVGQTPFSQTFTVDCDHSAPGASSQVACSEADGTVTITLTNSGTKAVVFHVTNPFTNVVADVPVGIGGNVPVSFAGFADGTHTVTISADGVDYSQTFPVNCDIIPVPAQVSVPVPVSNVASSPPVPPAASDAVVVQLPRTGTAHLQEKLALGFGAMLLGGVMLLGRRRLGAR